MRRIIAWCVAGFPFAPQSRRAIDETLADWAHEQQQAATRRGRTLARVRGLSSIARVVSMTIVRETADFGWTRGLGRRCTLLAVLVALISLAMVSPMLDAAGARTLGLALLATPLTWLVVTPPAVFLIFAWRPVSRTMPTGGTACVLALMTLALAGWLVPLSSDLLNDVLRRSLDVMSDAATEVPAHLSPGEAALAVTGWACLAGASAIVAAAVAKRSPLRSLWWLAGVPAIYAAAVALSTIAIGTSFIVFRTAGDPPEGFRPGIAAWTTATLLLAFAMAYGRRTVRTDGLASAE